jgi:hypothetical protein
MLKSVGLFVEGGPVRHLTHSTGLDIPRLCQLSSTGGRPLAG